MLNFNIPLRKYPALDGLRFVAVTLVFLSHTYPGNNTFFRYLNPRAFIGVEIFFALSGFIITNKLLEEFEANERLNITLFLKKRMQRLWPAWIVAITISLSYVWYLGLESPSLAEKLRESYAYYLLHVSNFYQSIHGHPHGVLSHFWTLAVEEHFYLLWPFILLLYLKKKYLRPLILILGFSIPFICRIYNAQMGYKNWSTQSIFDCIFFGCVLALYWKKVPEIRLKWAYTLFACSLLLFFIGLDVIHPNYFPVLPYWARATKWTLYGLSSTILVAVIVKSPENIISKFLSRRTISALGVVSYEFYLFHLLVIDFFSTSSLPLNALIAYVASWIAAFLVYSPRIRAFCTITGR